MESLSSLTFKGSFSEAIAEAKEKKKLLLVYLSGKDEESEKLDKLTFTDATVVESISKYCVLLHARIDPTTFSATFPYSSVPCVTAIGSSGVHVWNNEGFIGAVDLTSSIKKAWLGLNILETTASILGEKRKDEVEELEIGDELKFVFQTRLIQFFNWMERRYPRSSSFFETASNAFDDSRSLIFNKAAGKIVIREKVIKKKGGAARFAVLMTVGCFVFVPTIYDRYNWLLSKVKKEEKEKVGSSDKKEEKEEVKLREVLKSLEEKVSANNKDTRLLQLEASKMREWRSVMEASSSANKKDITLLQLEASKMREWRSAMEASSLRRMENARIARQELHMAMDTAKFNKMMRGL